MKYRVGDWSFRLESDGSVAHVEYQQEEVLRGVRYVVRQAHTWETVEPVTQMNVTTSQERVEIQISADHDMGNSVFHREATIVASPQGITFTSTGLANKDFDVNRNGWVLLQPLSVAGLPVEITHGKGHSEQSIFPIAVSPHQPFVDVAEFSYRTAQGTSLRITFDGDVFETEDQRNWSDASYKTYSRPLTQPFPFRIKAKEVVRQTIRVVLDRAATPDSVPRVTSAEPKSPEPSRPSLGVTLGPNDDPVEAAHLFRELHLDHVRVDIVVDQGKSRGVDRASILIRERIPVEVFLHVGHPVDAVLDEVADVLRDATLSALVILDNNAPATTVRAWGATSALRSVVGDTPVFVGTDDNFAELNRNRPDPTWGVGVTFGLNPQLHDQREEAVIETLESLPAMIGTASGFGMPVAVGSLTMRPRRNIYTGSPIDRLACDQSSIDPRQATTWAADWLRGTLFTLAAVGTARVTALEFFGPSGIVNPHGGLLPVGEVLAELAQQRGWLS